MDPSAGYLKEYQLFSSSHERYGSTKRWRRMAGDGGHDPGFVQLDVEAPLSWKLKQKEVENERLKNEQHLRQLEIWQAKRHNQARVKTIQAFKALISDLEQKERRCEIHALLEEGEATMSKEQKDALYKELTDIEHTPGRDEDKEDSENNENPQEQ